MRHPLLERSIPETYAPRQGESDDPFIKITPWSSTREGYACNVTYFNGHMPPLGGQVLVPWSAANTARGYQNQATSTLRTAVEGIQKTVITLGWNTQQEFLNVPIILREEI